MYEFAGNRVFISIAKLTKHNIYVDADVGFAAAEPAGGRGQRARLPIQDAVALTRLLMSSECCTLALGHFV